MKRNAGAFLRTKLLRMSHLQVAGVGIVMGLPIGYMLQLGLDALLGDVLSMIAYFLIAFISLNVILLFGEYPSKWSVENMEKGLSAERRIGQIIEYAITSPHCAVAHGVTTIAKVGDIDHLVATPASLCVIETKYQRVPPKHFPNVLRSIAANVKSVRGWVPPGTEVRGCLVLAYESSIRKRDYSKDGEQVRVYTPELLKRELRREACLEPILESNVPSMVWKLGSATE